MAQLSDWLNRKVLYLDIEKHHDITSTASVRLVFQNERLIDNETGWKTIIQSEVRWYHFALNNLEISNLIKSSKEWLALPISELGKTYFTGKWDLGGEEGTKLEIEFGSYELTPSKTDWFMVHIEIASPVLQKVERFHVDQSSLAIFVNELSEQFS